MSTILAPCRGRRRLAAGAALLLLLAAGASAAPAAGAPPADARGQPLTNGCLAVLEREGGEFGREPPGRGKPAFWRLYAVEDTNPEAGLVRVADYKRESEGWIAAERLIRLPTFFFAQSFRVESGELTLTPCDGGASPPIVFANAKVIPLSVELTMPYPYLSATSGIRVLAPGRDRDGKRIAMEYGLPTNAIPGAAYWMALSPAGLDAQLQANLQAFHTNEAAGVIASLDRLQYPARRFQSLHRRKADFPARPFVWVRWVGEN